MKPLVLIVEDCKLQRDLLRDCLIEIHGCEVICSCDGEEGINTLKKEGGRISLVFSDLRMPRKNGLEVVKFIKENFPGIKAVIMTADPAWMIQEAVIGAGADELLQKPFDIKELSRLINGLEMRLVS
ncbi:MAG: response regulator [Patescibacteria group bacterium]